MSEYRYLMTQTNTILISSISLQNTPLLQILLQSSSQIMLFHFYHYTTHHNFPLHIYIYIHTYICVCVCVFYVYVCVCVCVSKHVHTDSCIHFHVTDERTSSDIKVAHASCRIGNAFSATYFCGMVAPRCWSLSGCRHNRAF